MPEGHKIPAERQLDLNPCFYPESNNVSLLAGLLTHFIFQILPILYNRTVVCF